MRRADLYGTFSVKTVFNIRLAVGTYYIQSKMMLINKIPSDTYGDLGRKLKSLLSSIHD